MNRSGEVTRFSMATPFVEFADGLLDVIRIFAEELNEESDDDSGDGSTGGNSTGNGQ
ncbi:hypothetical protein N9043_01550 [bacterium]|nr:hypothetical protein [bacterium]MDA7904377.1 hypothetical protein [bacterium]MDA7905393.1 hypothetical protein [Mariniblastus sp.]MDA7924917.1 hypothetical protein [Mariniblastus sp.]MDB4461616.1 hypothetical protein [bacterium]|tara:strand:- start:6159 stop:6329 length:171 start_codon:yes stop_codon:yes gene_type:complete